MVAPNMNNQDQILEPQMKQFVADDGAEIQIIQILFNIGKYQESFFAHNEIAAGVSDLPNTIVEYDYGWQIMIKGSSDVIGRIQLQGYPTGVLISCQPEDKGYWKIMDEFMSQLFKLMEADGLTIRPKKGKLKKIEVKEFSTSYEKVPLQHIDPCKRLVPKSQNIRLKWKKAYSIISIMKNEYAKEYADANTDNPLPTLDDYRDGMALKMKWKPSEKTVRKIIKAGNAGCLK